MKAWWNLAGAYATGITGNKFRLLVIDLDYQGTLGNMRVATDFILHLRKTNKTAEELLSDENVGKESGLILEPLMAPFEGTDKRSKAIVADEALDHIDFRQQARFAVERSEVRFNYRRILHDPFVLKSFDCVFFRLSSSPHNFSN